jgi:hypothetical protein
MTKTRIIAVVILFAVLLISTLTVLAQTPWENLYIYTPEGLKPGAKFTVTVGITTTKGDKFSSAFVRVTTIPIYIETSDDAQLIHYLLLNETVTSMKLHLEALKQYAFNNVVIQPRDTYGYVLPPSFRAPGTYTGNLTLTVPSDAQCGETLFLFINVIKDGESHDAFIPVGIVCDAYRVGIYTEKQIADLQNKYQVVLKENTALKEQVDDQTKMLNKCISEKTQLNNTLQEKEKAISTYASQVGELQKHVEELQRQVDQQGLLNEALTVTLVLTYIAIIFTFIAKRFASRKKASQ